MKRFPSLRAYRVWTDTVVPEGSHSVLIDVRPNRTWVATFERSYYTPRSIKLGTGGVILPDRFMEKVL